MEQKTEKTRFRLNLFDSIVLFVVLCLGGVFLWSSLNQNSTATTSKTKQLHYQIMIKESQQGTGEQIAIGSTLEEVVKNYHLGTITNVTVLPAKKQVLNHLEQKYQTSVLEGYEDILVDLEVTVTETDYEILADGSFELKVGNLIYLRGAGYMAAGYIYQMDRLD